MGGDSWRDIDLMRRDLSGLVKKRKAKVVDGAEGEGKGKKAKIEEK